MGFFTRKPKESQAVTDAPPSQALEEKVWGRPGGAKEAPLVTATPKLIQIIQSVDGASFSYGQLYRDLPPVRTVVDFLADAISSTPLKVYRRAESGRPEARDHPLAKLLRRPNPYLTTRSLIWRTQRDLGVYGNAYWEKAEQGGTKWLVPLPVFRVTPRGGDLLDPSEYRIWMPNGTLPRVLPREKIVHFRLHDPEEPRIGSSKLRALTAILNEEIAAGRFRKAFWENAARIEGVLEQKDATTTLSDDAYDRLRTGWENLYTGSENSGRTAILEGGFQFKPMSFSAKDSEYLEGRKFILEATARVFNIPLPVMQLTETPTYASAKEAKKALYQDALPPWYELIQSEIELQVLPWFEGSAEESPFYVEFNVESKLRGSFDEQAEWLEKLIGRPIMTAREGRNLLNLTRRDDPSDDLLAVPVNNVSLGAPTEPPALPQAAVGEALKAFFTRQESSVMSRIGAGHVEFDEDRWNRELARFIDEVTARDVNEWTKTALAQSEDNDQRRAVFAHLQMAADSLG